jgi:hypothetical protein
VDLPLRALLLTDIESEVTQFFELSITTLNGLTGKDGVMGFCSSTHMKMLFTISQLASGNKALIKSGFCPYYFVYFHLFFTKNECITDRLCLPICISQLCNYSTDLDEIWYCCRMHFILVHINPI